MPAGACVIVNAEGFQPGEAVTARLLSSATRTAQVRADGTGTVHYQFQVATPSSGSKSSVDVLTLVESLPAHPGAGPAAASGNVTVTVPRFAVYRFTVRAAKAPADRPLSELVRRR